MRVSLRVRHEQPLTAVLHEPDRTYGGLCRTPTVDRLSSWSLSVRERTTAHPEMMISHAQAGIADLVLTRTVGVQSK